MSSSRQAVVSFGVGQRFAQGIERLAAGLDANGFQGTVQLWSKCPEGWPAHTEIPYAFKLYAIKNARDNGCEQVLWIDAACVPVKPLDGLFRELGEEGHAFPYSPFNIGEWCSDAALGTMGISRRRVMAMVPSMWATVVGLDFSNVRTADFFDRWWERCHDGTSFHGSHTNGSGEVSADPRVKGHRHDQAIATILAYQMNMPFSMNVVTYDVQNTMPLENYERFLRLPNFPTPVLSNHNVKTQAHSLQC